MDIYVLNTSFERIGIIDYCTSIIWTTRYCDAGDFELYLPATSQAIELLRDGREISSNTNSGTLTTDEYNALLAETGNEALAKAMATESFNGSIEPNTNYIFGKDYFLGDIVNIKNEYGISAKVRIIEVIESWDENGYSCIPTFDAEEV